jgi:hypothetical protein
VLPDSRDSPADEPPGCQLRDHGNCGDGEYHVLEPERTDEARSLEDTLDRAWAALATLPRRELTMVPTDTLREHLDSPERQA